MKINYDCKFDVKKFPFDGQNCSFIMKLKSQKMTAVQFVTKNDAIYEGPEIVGQFAIGEIHSHTNKTERFTQYTITFPMKRKFTNQLLNTFIPTLILWFFGYSTLFIDMDDFSDRYMGAGTSLLVIATLLGAVSGDLPKTSYMKHIDVWFLWHNMSIFLILIYHILLNRLRTYLENLEKDEVFPFHSNKSKLFDLLFNIRLLTKYKGMAALIQGNKIVIVICPIMNIVFYVIYFYYTLQ